jgi:hypothetical protein
MTYAIKKNIVTEYMSDVVFEWKELAKTKGWVVKASGDGVNSDGYGYANTDGYLYLGTGDTLTHKSTGAHGFSNANAWFRIQMPLVDGYNRELLFYRSSSDRNYLEIYYSFKQKFTLGGTFNARATAADEKLANSGAYYMLLGSPTPTLTKLNFFIACGDGYDGYNSYICGIDLSPSPNHGKILFAIDKIDQSSLISGDEDPYVFWDQSSISISLITDNVHTINIKYWMSKGSNLESWVSSKIFIPSGNSWSPFNYGLNYTGGAVDVFSPIFGRGLGDSLPRGVKGTSSIFQFHAATPSELISGDTLSTGITKDKIVFSDLVLPWDNSEPII